MEEKSILKILYIRRVKMKILEENDRINEKIAFELAKKYFANIDNKQLESNLKEVSKEYKKFIVEAIEEYDINNCISEEDLSI